MSFLDLDTDASFLQQFEADGDGFVYRKRGKGPAYRISRAERAAFGAAYTRHFRYLVGGSLLALLIWIIGMMTYRPDAGRAAALYPAVAMFVVVFGFGFPWLVAAPARHLAHRVPVAPAYSRAEARRIYFRHTSYGELALIGLLGSFELVVLAMRHGDWDMPLLIAAAGLMGLVVFEAVRKYLHDHR